jgi:hypothetical protein
MSELVAADQFILERLTAAPAVAAGKVYPDEAPAGTAVPYVVFGLQGGFDDLTEVGALRVWANLLYLVRVIGQGTSYSALQPTADAIDARLDRQKGPVGSGYYVESCVREQPFRMPETTPTGVRFRHLGGLYRLRVRPL